MIGIRWLNELPCGYMTTDGNTPSYSHEGSALFELNPTREVCVEIMPTLEDSWRKRDDVGLLVDSGKTELVRVYAEDVWSELMEDGISVRAPGVDEDTCWGDYVDAGWENARKVYDSIPAEEREGWAEGIVRKPKYTHIIIKGRMDMDMLMKASALKRVFKLPVINID